MFLLNFKMYGVQFREGNFTTILGYYPKILVNKFILYTDYIFCGVPVSLDNRKMMFAAANKTAGKEAAMKCKMAASAVVTKWISEPVSQGRLTKIKSSYPRIRRQRFAN